MGINLCAGASRLSAYYAGAGIIPLGSVGYPYGVYTPIPITGPIALSNFYGAEFDAGMLINGDFSTNTNVSEDIDKFRFLGWTILKRSIRLNGNSYILNLLSPATTTPIPAPPGGATSPGDNVSFATDVVNNPLFSYKLVDTSSVLYAPLAVPGSSKNFILELRNKATFGGPITLSNPNAYGIMRGPLVISDYSFSMASGDTISFNWRAFKDPAGDSYAVFIYLVKYSSQQTITLLDVYGNDSLGWQTVSRTLGPGDPTGDFKIVIVHGSYDSTGGLKVGAYLYLHDIKVT